MKDIVHLQLGYEKLPSEKFFSDRAANNNRCRTQELKTLKTELLSLYAVVVVAKP